jgi:hypothetical protein
MNLLELLMNSGGDQAVPQIARQFGIGEDQAQSALGALLPALSGALGRNMSQGGGGLETILGALGGAQGMGGMDPEALLSSDTTSIGNGILGQLFGSKDVSRAVASRAAEQTGIGGDVMKALLPVAATMLMSTLMKQGGSGNALSALVGGGTSTQQGGGLLGSLASMLDQDKDGNPFDDILGMLGR